MSPRASLLRYLALGGIAFAGSGAAHAQLASKSPFMPAQGAASNAPTPGAPLEFRGYMETSEGVQYRVHDPAKKTGIWMKLNEKNPEFDVVVKQHDNVQGTLVIEHQGKTLTLAERTAKVVSSGTAAQAIPPPVMTAAPASNVAPAVTQTVVLNPTPADEKARLDAVATEVARRRALREQATQQQTQQLNQGVTPQVTVPQVAQPAPAQQNFRPQNDGNQRVRGQGPGSNRQR
jgi:hypothetical protein